MTANVGSDFTFGGLAEGANNDCTPTGSDIVSVTIQSSLVSGAASVTLCVPRPHDFSTALAVGSNQPQGVQPPVILENLSASTPSCFYNLEPGTPVSGTARAVGLCDDGAGSAGFALVIDVFTTLTGSGSGSNCGTADVELVGSAAVGPNL
jgi:hypothetical protein